MRYWFMNSALLVSVALGPLPRSEPSWSWTRTCLGPSQSMATQSSMVIHSRLGGVKCEMFARLDSSMFTFEKNCG